MLTRRLVLVGLLGLLLLAMWQVGVMLGKPDLVIGMIAGALAGLPATVVVLRTSHRARTDDDDDDEDEQRQPQELNIPHAAWPASFTASGITGDTEEWIDEGR